MGPNWSGDSANHCQFDGPLDFVPWRTRVKVTMWGLPWESNTSSEVRTEPPVAFTSGESLNIYAVVEDMPGITLRGRFDPALLERYTIDSGGAHDSRLIDDGPGQYTVMLGEVRDDGATTGLPVLIGLGLATASVAVTRRRRRGSADLNADFVPSASDGGSMGVAEDSFGDVLRRYRTLLGVTKTKLSELLGSGFSIGELSLLERGLKPPPTGERKLNHLATKLADAIATGHSKGPEEAAVLKDQILRELSVSSAAYRPVDVQSVELAMRWIADLMTGDESNAEYARDAVRASRSISEAYDVMFCLFPGARARAKQLDLVRPKSHRSTTVKGKGSPYGNGRSRSG